MRFSTIVTILFTLAYNNIFAQTVPLHVQVKADSLTNATIQLYSLPDSNLTASHIGRNTTFQLKPHAKYVLRVSAIGYTTAEKLVNTTTNPISLTIALSQSASNLNAVTVTGRRPVMRQEDDKTILDAETLAASSTNAYEVLEKAPGLVIDQDGNIYLTSATPATVYINGRQMRMSNDDIAALLKSLPAGSILRIEVIRTPSAKYDAANSGGIVNVVLKKGIRIGTTGTANIRYDQGVYSSKSAGLSINNSAGKLSTYLSYQYTNRKYFEDINSQRRLSGDTSLSQSSTTRYNSTTHYIGGGLAYEVSKKFDLAYDLRLTTGSSGSRALSTNDLFQDGAKDPYSSSRTPIINNSDPLFINNSVNAKLKLDSAGSEWSTQIDYTYNKNDNTQQYTNQHITAPSPDVNGRGDVRNRSGIFDIRSDLAWHGPYKLLVESGIKLSDAAYNNRAQYYTQTASSPETIDPYQTNTFKYNENIHSAYAQLSRTFYGVTVKAGLRFENTEITGHQTIPSDTSFSIRRNDLFPYFYLRKPLFRIFGYPLTGNATWRRSITRPGYDALSPYPHFIDPFTYSVGNTRLQPQFTTNYEINSTYNDFPVFAIGVNDTKNVFSPVTYQNDSTHIAFRTYDNIGKFKEIYGRLFGGLPAGGRYFMYAGVQFNHIKYDGQYAGSPLLYSRTSWTFFMGHELRITPVYKLNMNGWMYANGFRQFNQLGTMGQLNMSLTRTFWDRRLSIVLSGNDILRTNKSTFHLQVSDIRVDGIRTQDSRRFGITCRYNFGLTRPKPQTAPLDPQSVTPDTNQ